MREKLILFTVHCILCKPVNLVAPDMPTVYPGLNYPIPLDLLSPIFCSAENDTKELTLGRAYNLLLLNDTKTALLGDFASNEHYGCVQTARKQ